MKKIDWRGYTVTIYGADRLWVCGRAHTKYFARLIVWGPVQWRW